jgi:hypothetical protein
LRGQRLETALLETLLLLLLRANRGECSRAMPTERTAEEESSS